MTSKTAVIVNSCDEYWVLWEAFFTLFRKFWSDCPFKIYLFSQNPERFKGVKPLIRKGKWWSNAYKKALENIPEKYFIWADESGMFTEKIETQRVIDYIDILKQENLVGIHFNAFTRNENKENFETPNKLWAELVTMRGDNYSICLQPSCWNKEKFIKYINKNETIWEMEINGSKRAINETKIAAPKRERIMNVLDITIDGVITQEGSDFLKKQGIFTIPAGLVIKKLVKYPNKCK